MKAAQLCKMLSQMAVASKVVSKRSARAFMEDGTEKEAYQYNGKKLVVKYDEAAATDEVESTISTSTSSSACQSEAEAVSGIFAESVSTRGTEREKLKVADIVGGQGHKFHATRSLPAETIPGLPASDTPVNFGIVVPGVYRSSFPKSQDHAFMKNLGLKTVVTLVQKDFPEGYKSFLAQNGIRHYVFNMKGTKKEAIPIKTMRAILRLVLDRQNHPLLIHCNHGKHRTGCVVAIVRKVSGCDLSSIIDEYKAFAGPKVRECDIRYITAFEPATLTNLFAKDSIWHFRVRNFFRVTCFTLFVLLLWFVSGTTIVSQKRKYAK